MNSFDLACLFFAGAIILHNTEEFLWLAPWSQTAGKWSKPLNTSGFRKLIVLLTIGVLGLIAWAYESEKGSLAAHLVSGYALAMWLNVFHPHLLSTIALRRYSPGFATALLANLPATSFLLYQALSQNYVTPLYLAISSVAIALTLLICVPYFSNRFE